jgi:hydrogenase/urease accessory protein HupE
MTPAPAVFIATLLTSAALCMNWVEPAWSHLGDLSYSEIVVRDGGVDYKIRFAAHLIPGTNASEETKLLRRDILEREPEIAEWLGETVKVRLGNVACNPTLVDSAGPDENDDLTVVLTYECPEGADTLRIEFRAFDESVPTFQNIASIRYAGHNSAFVFTAESRILTIGRDGSPKSERAETSFVEFVRLGIEHIWTGYDHLLFLLALLLPGGTIRHLAAIVTAFTIAHSITLALAALDVVSLPSAPVEAAIAASIVFAALDGLRRRGGDRRPALTFAFGLIHGFGFAGILKEVGLTAGAIVIPLVGFNVGVEAGQLAVVLVAVPLIRAATARPRGLLFTRALLWMSAAIGTFWLAGRLSAWLL